jgi:hypothetical protein
MKDIFYSFLYYPQRFFHLQFFLIFFFPKNGHWNSIQLKNSNFSFEISPIYIYIYIINMCILLKEIYE